MQRNTKTSRRTSRAGGSRASSGPGISIIGAGRVGTALGVALKSVGYRLELVIAKRSPSARRAARAIGGGVLGLAAEQLNRLKSSQLKRLISSSVILITTPDDEIGAVAKQLAQVFKSIPRRINARDLQSRSKPSAPPRIVLHASGALSSSVLEPLRNVGFAVGSLHPLVSISDSFPARPLFRNIFFCVEGERPAVRAAESIARALGGHTFKIDRDQKALYHAAAVMVSGNTVALFDIAVEMLKRCGLSGSRAHDVLLPLLESSVNNLARTDSAGALTGPLTRGDIDIVRKHLAAIESADLPVALAAYVTLGRRSISLTKKGQLRPARRKQLTRLLSASAEGTTWK